MVSIKAREIYFKRDQSEDYVGVTMVQVSYRIFFDWFATDICTHFETLTRGVVPRDCFKMPSGICSEPKEKYTVTNTKL